MIKFIWPISVSASMDTKQFPLCVCGCMQALRSCVQFNNHLHSSITQLFLCILHIFFFRNLCKGYIVSKSLHSTQSKHIIISCVSCDIFSFDGHFILKIPISQCVWFDVQTYDGSATKVQATNLMCKTNCLLGIRSTRTMSSSWKNSLRLKVDFVVAFWSFARSRWCGYCTESHQWMFSCNCSMFFWLSLTWYTDIRHLRLQFIWKIHETCQLSFLLFYF